MQHEKSFLYFNQGERGEILLPMALRKDARPVLLDYLFEETTTPV